MEQPQSILVMSQDENLGEDFLCWQNKPEISSVTRLLIKSPLDRDGLLKYDAFSENNSYDVIVIADVLESLPVEESLLFLKKILKRTKKQAIVLVEERDKKENIESKWRLRRYHPVVFRDFDFSYLLTGKEDKNPIQIYGFYPQKSRFEISVAKKRQGQSFGAGKTSLRLAYILPDQDLTGGMKQLLLQVTEMHKRGHQISLYTKSETALTAIPPWSDLTESDIHSQHVLKMQEDYLDYIDYADAIILGWMEQVPEFKQSKIPVFLWEQGSRPIFGDFAEPQSSGGKQRLAFHSYYQPPIHLLAVSPLIQAVLRARFGRSSQLVSAAVTPNTSHPVAQRGVLKQVLLVGDGQKDFKNFKFALAALELAALEGDQFTVNWATPTPPEKHMGSQKLKISYYVAPSQEKLDLLYKSADLVLSHSLYEAFSLPPLEAMAAGTAVIATKNGGIETYARSGTNCLLCEQGDLAAYTKGIQRLLRDDALRLRLAAAGLATSQEFTVKAMCDSLETALNQLI